MESIKEGTKQHHPTSTLLHPIKAVIDSHNVLAYPQSSSENLYESHQSSLPASPRRLNAQYWKRIAPNFSSL